MRRWTFSRSWLQHGVLAVLLHLLVLGGLGALGWLSWRNAGPRDDGVFTVYLLPASPAPTPAPGASEPNPAEAALDPQQPGSPQ